jgi:hypothetical protein
MPEPGVVVSYVVTYGAILGYAAWLEFRRRRGSPEA